MNREKKRRKSIVDRLTYAYIRKIKKWMFCPSCQEGKMVLHKKSALWICEDCGYQLSADEFEDDYIFWFCDGCNAYLNIQEGFDCNASVHICTKCGYKNDTSFSNIKGVCSDCGKTLPDPDTALCVDCRQARRQRAKETLLAASQVAGAIATAAGADCSVPVSDEGKRGDCTPPLEEADFDDLHWKSPY